ncbi:hypothetical protein DACRYDRAFT_116999 [Dacryopinax primogenitus]|uniref:PLD phosphodiesterase domain-containing protein n=1 Tax=Dacryopinax primogenitus (strain DJM 731) TaxID=1858805 RepID=M5FVV4_DACPD|nr:uncharacterized protein DACRYDRAFT_116999 [Dacryopinax primogenitus]EJU00489.1 hypothetical protein DACRYDRAFT_116999 [Dacryopinax primogenitus]
MVNQRVVDLCHKEETVTSYLHKHPNKAPHKIPRKLFPKPNLFKRLFFRYEVKRELHHGQGELTEEMLDRVATCGKFQKRPSDLFLKMYADVLLCLERDPMSGLVSPPLLGSTGVIPLSIISVIPDIMQHYYDVIVRAEREVILATNYWQPSRSVTKIREALRQLSKNAGEKKRKVIVKLMYDRGALRQFVHNHTPVPAAGWKAVDLPEAAEIPNIQMEVINFHRPLLGTFHSKYLIVDRKVALLNSNNIQDRPNMEMMVHLEGPVVDSLFDMAMLSWNNALRPPLPSLLKQIGDASLPAPARRYLFGKKNPYIACKDIEGASRRARGDLRRQHTELLEELERERQQRMHNRGAELWDTVREAFHVNASPTDPTMAPRSRGADLWDSVREAFQQSPVTAEPSRGWNMRDTLLRRNPSEERMPSRGFTWSWSRDPTAAGPRRPATLHHVNMPTEPLVLNNLDAPMVDSPTEMRSRAHSLHENQRNATEKTPALEGSTAAVPHTQNGSPTSLSPSPEKLVPLRSDGAANIKTISDPGPARFATTEVLSNIPGGHVDAVMLHDSPDHATGENSALHVSVQNPHDSHLTSRANSFDSVLVRHTSLAKVAAHLNLGNNCEVDPTATELDGDFKPHILHKPHDPVPIAMVSRRPHGAPGHKDIRTPQNAAWLGAFRYAQRKVIIQTPTFNAAPVVAAALSACRRGVEVVLFLDLGFNDQGEMIPGQGGTNEQVVFKMYRILKEEGQTHEKNLKVYWYTGKDQIKPMNARVKQRNCHVKFCAVDDQVGIVGNGNQDTQSWFHSQEINIMVDSPAIVEEWLNGLDTNQNTLAFGLVDDDGIWRYRDGEKKGQPLEDLGGLKSGLFTSLREAIRMVQKARG